MGEFSGPVLMLQNARDAAAKEQQQSRGPK